MKMIMTNLQFIKTKITVITMKRKLSRSEDLKLMIIENFIEWYTSSDKEREEIKECAFDYVDECHYNELEELIKLN